MAYIISGLKEHFKNISEQNTVFPGHFVAFFTYLCELISFP